MELSKNERELIVTCMVSSIGKLKNVYKEKFCSILFKLSKDIFLFENIDDVYEFFTFQKYFGVQEKRK